MSLTDTQVDRLLAAYLERKKFEARVIWAMLGEALKKDDNKQMSLGALSMLGFGIRGI